MPLVIQLMKRMLSDAVHSVRGLVTTVTNAVYNSKTKQCQHKSDDIFPAEDESIWHVTDSYLEDDEYWSQHDAAFLKMQKKVQEFKCFGCGEEKTLTSGEVTEVKWKEDMTSDEIAEMHEQTNSGSWYNGQLWWEHNRWEGDAGKVATGSAWVRDIGYTKWKRDTDASKPEKYR